jgi:hypothetical protein
MHDDGDALPTQPSVCQPVPSDPVQDGRVARDPGNPPLALLCEPDVRDARPGGDVRDSHGREVISSLNQILSEEGEK